MTLPTWASESTSDEMRLQLYGVYESNEELRNEMEKYNIETTRVEDLESAWGEDEDDFLALSPFGTAGGTMDPTTTTTTTTTTMGNGETNNIATRQQTSADRDVWGRFALKEAKDPILCPACTRPINTNRFAMHLDKCMGIGTTVRSASQGGATTSTRSAAVGSSTSK
uniref:SAGA-associated factor 11 n=1 Tax=Amphora coffeiformis TaxID=265554 RepID=A0A7S3L521_9STRA|eukprot:scaffold655_cov162-Amphora_coffeaeformis.AAC.22